MLVAATIRMCRIRQCFLVILAAFAMPIAAQAQWATSRAEHDWRIFVGANSYGLLQQEVYTIDLVHGYRVTTIYFGCHTSSATRFRANYGAVMTLLIVGTVGVLSSKKLLSGKGVHDPAAQQDHCTQRRMAASVPRSRAEPLVRRA